MSFRTWASPFLLILAFSTPAMADWSLKPASALQKLTATAPGVLEKFTATPVLLRAARGEWEHFQVVIHSGDKPVDNLEILPSGLATAGADFIPASSMEIYRENYVHIPKPSGNRRLEKLWWPDALIPWKHASKRIEAKQSAVFWVTVKVPENAAPGDYFGELDILADGKPKRLALGLKVEPVSLPPLSMRATAAVYYGVLRDWYAKNANKTFTDAEWTTQQRRYYDFLLDYGITAYDLPVAWGTPEAATYLKNPRVHSVRVPPLGSADFDTALAQLKATGTLKKAYYYHIDEPQPDKYAAIKETTAKLRPLGIKHLVTVHPNESLKDQIDIWCPNIGDFFGIKHLDAEALSAERKKGRETWWYTMVEPRYPYPTWLVDDDAESVREYGRLMAKYGITGFVYSMAHGWGPKPLEDITSFANTSGDGTLIYPAELVGGEGPMPSIRLMLLRDAMEDYELIRLALAKGAKPYWDVNRDDAYEVLLPRALAKNQVVLSSRRPNLPTQPPYSNDAGAKRPTFVSAWAQFAPRSLTPIPVPTIDGALNDKAWSKQTQWSTSFKRHLEDNGQYPATQAWAGHAGKVLYVAVKGFPSTPGEWFAVDVAPEDLSDAPERLRFVITQRGRAVVERHTRDGHFQVEVPGYKSAVKVDSTFWSAEFAIPLEPLGYGDKVRLNVRRRTTVNDVKATISAVADAEDPWVMPVLDLRSNRK